MKKNTLFKLITVIALLSLLLAMLAGCNKEKDEDEDEAEIKETVAAQESEPEETEPATQATETVPTTEAPAPEPPAPVAMTYEEFVEKTTGCWYDPSTVNLSQEDYHFLTLAALKEDGAIISQWPGEMTRSPFHYDKLEWVEGNVYLLHYSTPPTNFEGVTYPGTTGTITFTFMEDGSITLEEAGQALGTFVYGGTTTQEAAAAAKAWAVG